MPQSHEPTISSGTTFSASILIQIAWWITAGLLTYGAVNARVAVLESKYDQQDRRLIRIEDKLDRVLGIK